MKLEITRQATDDRRYSVNSGTGTRYGVEAPELKRWLLDLGVGASTINSVLEIEPAEKRVVQVVKAA